MAGINVFSIPGTIKTQYAPFVLDKATSPGIQEFSFRSGSNAKKLNICPTSVAENFSLDIANKMLYQYDKDSRQSLDFNSLLNQLPGIQIREFLPDTKLEQTINFFGQLIDSVKELWSNEDDKKIKDETKQQKEQRMMSFGEKVKNIMRYAFDYLVGAKNVNITNVLGRTLPGNYMAAYPDKTKKDVNQFVLDFPYTLYYTLQSCTTTNIYTLPCMLNDNRIAISDGTLGWKGGSEYRIGGLLTKIPYIGSAIQNILGNIGINFMPWWDAESGDQTQEPEVEVTFDLFNDTADAAMTNFIFVNTIIPNNKWIQYNMFQHSPNLYDIKIEGINRLFACTAKFSVTSIGVLRTPPTSWLEDLIQKHSNYSSLKLTGHEVKIPDIYHVTMTFASLLPANFNNYVYSFVANKDIVKPKDAKTQGTFGTFMGSLVTDFVKDMKDYIGRGMPSTWS